MSESYIVRETFVDKDGIRRVKTVEKVASNSSSQNSKSSSSTASKTSSTTSTASNATALNIADVKFGRNDDDAKIQAQMKSILEGLASYMTGVRYNEVINTIKKNWSGQDADAFIKSFQSKIATLKTELPKKYTQKYLESVKANMTEFKSAQAKNSANLKF